MGGWDTEFSRLEGPAWLDAPGLALAILDILRAEGVVLGKPCIDPDAMARRVVAWLSLGPCLMLTTHAVETVKDTLIVYELVPPNAWNTPESLALLLTRKLIASPAFHGPSSDGPWGLLRRLVRPLSPVP